ncbi:hypothetical protein [Prochlorococcus sp. MIT 1307]|uniref:hypothetical protein n=1 Tax=Prochlorococcus sp. MIT 1307 TaxID=3096219 RepID=UPI002A75FEBE|nr:hypothetical protein [Prochlorococcus sp. MIT 1307]
MSSPYSELRYLDVTGSGIGRKSIEISFQFLQKHELEIEEESNQMDQSLWAMSRNQPDSSEALLCLRCRVSHPIAQKVNLIFNNFRDKYELELKDMLVYVLDDTGEVFLRSSYKTDEDSNEIRRQPLNWNTLLEMADKGIRPFSTDIIHSFDPDLSGLSTWAKNKVQANSDLKTYLRSCGLLLISPWALIADSTPTRVREAWSRCGDGNIQVMEMESLHRSYLSNYKAAKEVYRKSTGKATGWVPDAEFLASLNPPQKNRENLALLDQAIRQYLVGTNFTRQFKEGEEALLQSAPSTSSESSNSDLVQSIHQALQRSTQPIVKAAIESDRPRWEKDPSRELAWQLYGQGLGQREIATRCDHKQAWVSKLLLEKTLSENIAQEAAVALVRRSEFKPLLKDPAGVDRMIEELRNYLVSSEQKGNTSLLRQAVHEALQS